MTPVCCGDVVHLEGRSGGGSLVVDREQGFLVLLPDSLLSGTSISNSIRCMRQAVLGDMFKVKTQLMSVPVLCFILKVSLQFSCFFFSLCGHAEFRRRLKANAERHHGP